ncbi:glycoside hydrolase family 5 protein [Brasilonema sp. UFV-L1]|uniref:glycoside hydrolase family 5 protein n=1 Tax=Brasilonema sp. UFV-L1 TaxID=2234130 RepID=UPI00145CD5D0|nr:glycoside hydrolase family 5 protein [Brasilonema sp. UFV-L1]NMG06802.1 glycoside hydrolase family 5 protein [Brasilonema sp. UFV-L1]
MVRAIFVKQAFTIVRNISFSIAYYYKKWRQFTKYIVAGLALVLLYTTLSSCSPQFPKLFDITTSQAAMTIISPLSTRGSRIVDAKGRVVLLRGVNWFGMELKEHAPHGLWVRDYKDMLAHIKRLGYNVIRLPYSVQALRSRDISGVDFSIGANKDLQGKTPIEVMDIIIQEAQRQELFIILDSHTLKDGKIPELWYGDGFTEKDWIDTWTLLAKRYKDYTNVIGADLKNEPHGRASWGTGDKATDWRLAAERAGNQILSVNPKWLILVAGVVENVPGQKQPIYAWGANLEGVLKYPVRLKVPKKLVYTPHEYAASHLPWVKEPILPGKLYKRLEIGFHYIATKGIAPILIGEFGGPRVDTKSNEGIWHRLFVDYINKKKLSFTYWCWNPNSHDTGGLLLDDWKSLNIDKQKLLSPLLR